MARLPRQRLRRPWPHLFLELLEDRLALSSANATSWTQPVLTQPASNTATTPVATAPQSWSTPDTSPQYWQKPQTTPSQWSNTTAASDPAQNASAAVAADDDDPAYPTGSGASAKTTPVAQPENYNHGGAVPGWNGSTATGAGAQSSPAAQPSTQPSTNQTSSNGETYNTQQAVSQTGTDTSQDSNASYYYCSPQMYIEMATYQQIVAANARSAAEAAIGRFLMEAAPMREQVLPGRLSLAGAAASETSQEVSPPTPENVAAPKAGERSGDASGVPGHRAPDMQTDWLAALDSGLVVPTPSNREMDQESSESLAFGSSEGETIEPQPGTLLAAAMPFDVGALERSVRQLFAQFEQSGGEAGWQRAQMLAWWLGAAATATAAFEWTRRRVISPSLMAGADAGCDLAWADDPDLALSPTRDDA